MEKNNDSKLQSIVELNRSNIKRCKICKNILSNFKPSWAKFVTPANPSEGRFLLTEKSHYYLNLKLQRLRK